MTDKKLTDNEIIKALECCMDEMGCTKGCPCFDPKAKGSHCTVSKKLELEKLTLDLINRLQAENIALNRRAIPSSGYFFKVGNALLFAENKEDYDITINAIKAEAQKELAEKVNKMITEIYNKHIFGANDLNDEEKDAIINFSDDVTSEIENILKESVSDTNAK